MNTLSLLDGTLPTTAPPITPSYSPSPSAAPVEVHDSKALQDRDDEFVKNLPPELIEEQKRIMAQIQKNSASSSRSAPSGSGSTNAAGDTPGTSSTIADEQARIMEQIQRNARSNKNSGTTNTTSMTPYEQKFDTAIVASTGPHPSEYTPGDAAVVGVTALPEEVHPNKYGMKQERKVKTAVGATTGAIIGAAITGPAFPIGAAVGGAIGGLTTKYVARHGERVQQNKHELKQLNDYTKSGQADVQSDDVTFA
mmetsp:Transcript_50821/g.56775  ORF Transcript_50821/g.56775 Transcript_50821/m.56775 type:complete len:253 (+) Transcript_50821:253-1011(+)